MTVSIRAFTEGETSSYVPQLLLRVCVLLRGLHLFLHLRKRHLSRDELLNRRGRRERHTSSSSFSRVRLFPSSFASHSRLSILSPSASIFAHCSEIVYEKIQVSPRPKSRVYSTHRRIFLPSDPLLLNDGRLQGIGLFELLDPGLLRSDDSILGLAVGLRRLEILPQPVDRG